MAKHRSHSIEFKRQVAQEFIAGETLVGRKNSGRCVKRPSDRHDAGRRARAPR